MKLSIVAFTKTGAALLNRLEDGMRAAGYEVMDASVLRRGGTEPRPSLHDWAEQAFSGDAVLFVGACGIAVRAIAPFVRDKFCDPAVVSVDELGRFAVPLLSGHVGGANKLAKEVAKLTGGVAVISTATDLHQKFAVDLWAASQGLSIGERELAKRVSAAVLAGEKVGFESDFPVAGRLPDGLLYAQSGLLGIHLTLDGHTRPFDNTLHLFPRLVTVGVGCRKGISEEQFEQAVLSVLASHQISLFAVRQIATIDRKSQEPCIRAFCGKYSLPLETVSAQTLVQTEGTFTGSAFVERTVGVDNVCERAAVACGGGELLFRKVAIDGVTVAAAMPFPELTF